MGGAVRLGWVAWVVVLFAACATGAPSPYAKGEGALEAGAPSDNGTGSSKSDPGGSGGTGGKSSSGDAGGANGGGGANASRDAGGVDPGTGGSVANNDAAVSDSCSDKKKGTGETGTDCGGPCPPCDNDQGCLVAADCVSLYCTANLICADSPVASCTDKMQNDLESDVDCGGGKCSACILGKKCTAPADCASMACTANKCACAPKAMAEACGTKNCGTTSDGCGATVACGTCGSTQMCNASGMCVDIPTCVAGSCPKCSFGLQNGCCTSAGACGCPPLLGGGCN